MNKFEKFAFASLALVSIASTGLAYGQSVQQVLSSNSIYACVKVPNGTVLQMSPTKIACPKGAKLLTWNVAGPKGDQGLQGLPGVAGPKGDPGTSATKPAMTYVVNESGDKYPVFYGPTGPAVQIAGIEYTYTNNPLYPIANFRSDQGYGFIYQSPNCEGTPFVATTTQLPSPLPNTAYTGADGHSITLAAKPDVKAETFKSFQSNEGCLDLDITYWSNAYSNWLDKVLSDWAQISSSSNPTDGSFTANFETCRVDASWKDYWGMHSIHDMFSDCFKADAHPDGPLASQRYQAGYTLGLYNTGPVTISFDKDYATFAIVQKYATQQFNHAYSPSSAALYAAQPAPFDAFASELVTGWHVLVE